jgi:glycosyltransferase involved in cell wall biosynthesis
MNDMQSPSRAEHLIGWRYKARQVTLVRNTPIYQAVEKNDRLRQYLGLGPEVRIALYQGNIQEDRRLDTLVRAAKFLERDVVLVLMGKDMRKTVSKLQVQAIGEGVAERVKSVPPVPYEELLEWAASADIGLIIYAPDHSLDVKMCLPNKLFEYMMAGLPVLATLWMPCNRSSIGAKSVKNSSSFIMLS